MSSFCDDAKWQSIFKGETVYRFESLAFSMMVGRLSRKFKKNPETLGDCIREANYFCDKYRGILRNDLAKLH